jgi:beta-mannosidase
MINLIGKKAQIACELLCCCSMAYAQSNDNSEVVVLNTGWEFSQAGTELWRPAQVPGTVHQDLINHKQLPDPFYGINEQKIQWVENEDWEYRTAFTVTPEQLKRDDAQLVFEGLDTYADVYLNGALLLKADNMFVGYTIPVKSQLRIGENLLHIYFHSPIRQTLPQYNSNGFNYPADNDHHDKHLSIFSRKAPYSYGWDWGIRMVTSGIWRPVTIRFYDAASISDYHVKQLALTDQLANLSNKQHTLPATSGRGENKYLIRRKCRKKHQPGNHLTARNQSCFHTFRSGIPRTLDAEWMGKARPV